MSDRISISEADGTWVVRGGGAILGESQRALRLDETGHDPVIYFPREDLAMAFLEPSDTRTRCPHKGEATYFSLQGESALVPDVGWSYEDPVAGAERIAGHIAFFDEKVAVEQL
jgi:uncharacterized protein (DUF427 family)